jgi:hypothetical protein
MMTTMLGLSDERRGVIRTMRRKTSLGIILEGLKE